MAFYLATMSIGWLLNITRLWSKIYALLLKVGIKDSEMAAYIEEIFKKPRTSFAGWTGTIIGGLIFLTVLIGIYRLKSWARKLLLLLSSLGIAIYVINTPKLLLFYKNIVAGKLWLGYYLFAFFILLAMGYLISILIFFSRKNIKACFN